MNNLTIIQETLPPKLIPMRSYVTLKKCGNIFHSVYVSHRNSKCSIRRINKDTYVSLSTGEVKTFNHNSSRKDDMNSVRSTLSRLRDYINTNATSSKNCLWVTLTYAENMTDEKRLYKDFDKFIKRMRYKKFIFEYIVACEPQGRGAWHCHLLMIFDNIAPYINNQELAEIWGKGFVKVKALDNVDNIGAYLTAYLGDIELNDENLQDYYANGNEKIKIKTDNKTSKRYIKGGRLHLYPKGFHLYRVSKGIKKPQTITVTEERLQNIVCEMKPTYEKAIAILCVNNDKIFQNLVYYRNYLQEND